MHHSPDARIVASQQEDHSYDLMLETLERGLAAGPWILGDRFTAPDVLLGSSIGFMGQFGVLPDRPVLAAYLQRCRDRTAFKRASSLEGDPADS